MNYKTFSKYLISVAIGLLLLSCDKEESNLFDSKTNVPFVKDLTVTPILINTDTIPWSGTRLPKDQLTLHLTLSVKVSDPDGKGDIKQVRYQIFKPASTTLVAQGELALAPLPLSKAAPSDDALYSSDVSFKINRVNVGNYRVEVYAVDKSNLTGNSEIQVVNITRVSRDPVISDLAAPDTVILPPENAPPGSLYHDSCCFRFGRIGRYR